MGTPFGPSGEPYDPNPQSAEHPYRDAPPADPYGYRAPAPPPYSQYGYSPYSPVRPGAVVAAGVLGYVNAGLLILASAMLFIGASAISDFDSTFGSENSGVTAELTFDGLVNLVAAGLLIAGGVTLAARRSTGRTMMTWGAGICLVEAVYWLVRTHAVGVVFWVLVFAALAVIGLSLAWTTGVTQWLRSAGPPGLPWQPPGRPW